jgi:hypothetical protein
MDEKNDFLKVDEENKKGKNKVIIILAIAIIVLAIILTAVLLKTVVSIKNNKETTRYEMTSKNDNVFTTDDSYLEDLFNNTDAQQVSDSEDENNSDNKPSKDDTTKNQILENYEHLSVNGENRLSDHYENEFIQLVSDKYDIDTDLLVAIYSVPDSGTNFVLQFDGTKRRGEYVKSPDTLEKVYQIDLDKNIKVATGTATGNIGVSYPESVLCVAMVKTIVMEQYPNYFTGLE